VRSRKWECGSGKARRSESERVGSGRDVDLLFVGAVFNRD
jgi:hypothetical protein